MTSRTFAHRRADFPPDFVFGTSTAAFQIEGGGAARGLSHWDDFCATPGNVQNAHDGQVACDHYSRWPEDLDFVAGAGFDAYRFSLSWPRIMPEGSGRASEDGLAFYDRLIDGMLERGIAPYATLYHWDLPSPLADIGGWRNRDVAERFAEYAGLVARRLGDRLHSIATLNEPYVAAWLGHFTGAHAPGLRDVRATARAMHYLLVAHGLGIRAMRAEGHCNLGIVTNHNVIAPNDGSEDAARAAALEDAIQNRWYWEGLFRATYPAEALEGLEPYMPTGWQGDMGIVAEPLDWFGVNYYRRERVAATEGLWPATRTLPGQGEVTGLRWEVYPEGLGEIMERTRTYTGELPLYVTENGAAYLDEPMGSDLRDDRARVSYYDRHLGAVRDVITAGVPLKGYFAWSLLDNFEWAEGYAEQFGLVHVDFATQARTRKLSYEAFKTMLAGERES